MKLSRKILNRKREGKTAIAWDNQIGIVRKKTSSKGILAAIFLIILATICIAKGRSWSKKGECIFQTLTIQSGEESFSGEWLQSALSGDALAEDALSDEGGDSSGTKRSFAAWREWKEETLAGTSSGRNASGNVIAVCGPSQCLLPIGKNLTPQDKEGCIIGQKLAEELFGDCHAEGQKITWQDSTWTVRGVAQEPARLLMVQVGRLPEMIERLHLNRINISLKDGEDRHVAGESFLLQNNLSAQVLRWDYLHGFSWFREMIPSQWSDFQGWKQNFQEHQKAAALARNAWKSSIEAWELACQKKGGRLSLAGGILLVLGLGALIKSFAPLHPITS